MSSSDMAIQVSLLSKRYEIYATPQPPQAVHTAGPTLYIYNPFHRNSGILQPKILSFKCKWRGTETDISGISMILVTGGAGFIWSNFVLDWLTQSDGPVVNLDKLIYAGNLSWIGYIWFHKTSKGFADVL